MRAEKKALSAMILAAAIIVAGCKGGQKTVEQAYWQRITPGNVPDGGIDGKRLVVTTGR